MYRYVHTYIIHTCNKLLESSERHLLEVGNINKNEELIEVKLFSDPNQLSFVNVILKSLKKKKEL